MANTTGSKEVSGQSDVAEVVTLQTSELSRVQLHKGDLEPIRKGV